jgi:flagellar motor component MotA
MSFRRINELLRGYLRGEEVVRLNQELSRRDIEQIEGGHLILNALKQLVPVLGFLGTVIGLSIAMVEFSDLTESAGLEVIRARLKGMGASLSVAFETTVLALGYAIILILVSSFLRKKEESFVAEVDNKARMLISKLSYAAESTGRPGDKVKETLERFHETIKDWLDRWQRDFSSGLKQFFGQLSVQHETNGKEIVEIFQKNGDAVIRKLDELKDSLRKPPRYEIIVQPLKGKSDE